MGAFYGRPYVMNETAKLDARQPEFGAVHRHPLALHRFAAGDANIIVWTGWNPGLQVLDEITESMQQAALAVVGHAALGIWRQSMKGAFLRRSFRIRGARGVSGRRE